MNVQETSAYVFIKQKLKKAHPEWSNKTLLEKTWEVMYGKSYEEAIDQAIKEFEDRGIVLQDNAADNIRFKRRVYEIIQQYRGEAVVKAGQYAANRYTFKAMDAGAGSGVYYGLMAIKKGVNAPFNLVAQALDKGGNKKGADIVRRAGNFLSELLFTVTLPFVKGVTNILEKRLELFPPYGIAKGVAYTVAARLNQDNPNSVYDYARAGEYYYRAAIGGLFMVLMKYWADDDEEGFKKIYASGTPDWRDNAVESKIAKQNTVTIGGRSIPMQAFSTMDLNLMIMGVYNDMAREKLKMTAYEQEQQDAMWIEVGGRMTSAIVGDEYLKGFQNMYKGITGGNDSYWDRTFAEYTTRSLIPATGFFRQLNEMTTKEQTKPITFTEHLMKQSGLVGGWLLDRKSYDVLGRTYDNGSMYGNSAQSFMNMYKKMPEVPLEYKVLYKYSPSLTQKSSNNEALDIMDAAGNVRKMDNIEYYDYGLKKGQYFDKLLTKFIENEMGDIKPEDLMPKKSNLDRFAINSPKNQKSSKDDKLFKEAVLQLKNEGKVLNLELEEDLRVIDTRVEDIKKKNVVEEEIGKRITEMNTMAYKVAFEEFLTERKLIVPLSIQGSKEKYKEMMEAMK